jgi:hypothetical protein
VQANSTRRNGGKVTRQGTATAERPVRGPRDPFAVGARVCYRHLTGRIVANIDAGHYAEGWATGRLRDLHHGVVVEWSDGTITHFREPALSLALAD